MNTPEPLPNQQEPPPTHKVEPRSRRRKRGQLNIPRDAEGRAALLTSLSHRAYPTYELFVFAALSGAIIGLGFVLDSQALLLFGILVAPLMLPWVGLLLAIVTGSTRFFFETLMALALSAFLVFIIGLLAGFAARAFLPHTFTEAYAHTRLWWPDLAILAIGAVILTLSFVRSEVKPFLPSVILAYEFFLPLGAGAFGLGSGVSDLWPHGLLVFIVHFAWACLFGLATLAIMRVLPATAGAFIFYITIGFLLIAILVVLMSGGNWAPSSIMQPSAAPQTDSVSNPPVQVQSTLSPPNETSTPIPFDLTPTSTETSSITETPTFNVVLQPTTVYAQINAPRGGSVLRQTPGGAGLTTLDNSTYVELLPETDEFSGYIWAHVVAIQNGNRLEGWVVQQYLTTSTPIPVTSATPAQ